MESIASFRQQFGISERHRLELIRYEQFGRADTDEPWEHHELDADRNLVARYESWRYGDKSVDSGWRKYAPNGRSVEARQDKPKPVAVLSAQPATPTGGVSSYTLSMTVKTTISLSEELFERLEREVSRSRTTRSRLVAQALEDRLKQEEDRRIEDQLNAVYAADPTEEDRDLARFLQRAARSALSD